MIQHKFTKYQGLVHYCVNQVNVNYTIKEDLIQEGSLALLLAISSFDNNKGKFITYAITCIKNSLINYITRFEQNNVPINDIFYVEKEKIEHYLPTLSDEELELINLRLQKYSYKEIAKQYNKPIHQIKYKIYKIYKNIKNKNV